MEEGQEKPRRRPLVRAASEESSSELSSISCSPAPGDTLPWNLPRHHRIKRSKSASGDVLDPAERAIIRIADERDRVQKKTFTKWVNKHLIKHWKAEAQRHVADLYEDLRDGHSLISLLEVLSGETLPRERDAVRSVRLPREKGRMRFHKLQNVQIALDFLKHRQVKLVNIRNDDIADGNPKLTLGLIWTIILHFQISDIQVNGQSDDMTAKEKLLLWAQRMVEGYQGLRCDNFTTSWRDGRLFSAIIHKHRPTLINMSQVYRQTNQENLEQAFSVAERDLGVTRLLDPEDVDVPHPDEKSIITYVSSLYDAMPRVPDVQDGVRANELELRWQEFYELVTLLLQWIRHHILVFEERKFPSSYEEIEVLWRQFLKFKETELPAKEADKNRSKHIFQSFEGAVQAGQVKVPPGYHPLDVEKEWGRLHVAILERERLLRAEFERLERLQRVVSKVQMESGVCEEQLNQVETLLQADMRTMSSGKPAQHAGEVEADLEKADGMIRLLFNDVQLLKDGRHLQAEQMYRRVYRLHERLVNLRSEYSLRLRAGVAASQGSLTQVQIPLTQVQGSVTQVHSAQVLQQSSSRARPELDEVTLRYVQELMGWVEENQRRVDGGDWGSDLPTVESQLGSHRGLHQSVEEFHSKIERAKADESQISPVSKAAYREYLGKLELQYAKLLSASKARLRHLVELHAFVSAATKELMWLNEKEEEEVGYDWSDKNPNMASKKDSYSGLMRELELREKKMNGVQTSGDKLLRDGHPARKTIEAFTAALQTQWSWILQLCCCIETHLKENTAYFQFFSDLKESEEKLQRMQEAMKKKYSCDRSATVTRLEDLLQDAAEDQEQLAEFQTHLEGLKRRARTVVQLRPRDPASALRGRQPVQAVCDFKQQEITVHRGDECWLLSNTAPSWRVQSAGGGEAAVPSVCFLVPPPNKDAVNGVAGLDGNLQRIQNLWQKLTLDLRSLLSHQLLMRDVHTISGWSVATFKSFRVEEHRLALRSLEQHYQDFLRDSQDSQSFGAEDRLQVESSYQRASQHYQAMASSTERGEQDESVCKTFLTQLRDIRLRLEGCETRTVTRLRQPVDKEPLKACALKTAEQMKVQSELEGLKKDLSSIAEQTEEVLASPQLSGSAPALRSELDLTLKKMDHVYGLSSVYLDKLKTIDVVIRNTKDAEEALQGYEDRLRGVSKVPADEEELEARRSQLQAMLAEAAADQAAFDRLQDELQRASSVTERMARLHGERDAELEHHRRLASGLLERWRAVRAQLDLRLRELELLGRAMARYRERHGRLQSWLGDARRRQEQIQAAPIGHGRALREQLAEEKKLLEEIEKNKDDVESCQKDAKAYIDSVKDYEVLILTYKALQDPAASPLKKPKVECASDDIIQEYVSLRTGYSELMTLSSQFIRFISSWQSRLEEDQKASEKLKEEERRRMAEMEAELDKQKQLAEAQAESVAKAEREATELKRRMQQEADRRQDVAADAQQQKQNVQQELQQLKSLSEQEITSKGRQLEEALLSRSRIEEEILTVRMQLETTQRQKSTAEGELAALRERAAEADGLRRAAQEEAERLRRQVGEETQRKKSAEEELKRRSEAEKEAARQKQRALEELQRFKLQAEEAERRLKQAEEERGRQLKVVEEVSQRSAASQLQSRSREEEASQLEQSLRREQGAVLQLQEEAERLRRQQEEASRAREAAQRELETWRQKANEALRLRLQAEEEAQKKSQAQEEAERQKAEAERDAKRRAKAEEAALRQKEAAEQELDKQRRLAEQVAQQKLSAEQECVRLRADFEHAEQQRQLLDGELQRLKQEVSGAQSQRTQLEAELARLRAEMEALLQMKAQAERDTLSQTEKSKQLLESEAHRMKQLAEEAARLRAVAEEAKKQRQTAEEEAARQRAQAEGILKDKLAAINEATRLKTEAEIALKAKEAENERLKRKAEEEAYQRKLLEDQAAQHKLEIQEKITHLKSSSDSELERQRSMVEETLKQKKVVEEEIHIIRLSFDKASKEKSDLEAELKKLKGVADDTQKSKLKAEKEAEKLKKLAAEEEKKRKEAEEKVKRIAAAEEEAARQCRAAKDEVERLKKKAADANKQREKAEKEAERQEVLAREAAQKLGAAEQKAQDALSRNKEDTRAQDKLRDEFKAAQALAEAAQKARDKAEKEAALLRKEAQEAEGQRRAAEGEAARQAAAQADAERLRKEAEQEASKRAAAEAAALKQKQQADAEMARHKERAEKALGQKAQVEAELGQVRLQLQQAEQTRALLDEELRRLKGEAQDAARQRAQVEEELAQVRAQMEQLLQTKLRTEEENRRLMQKDKDSAQKLLLDEAQKMKALAEEAARLSLEAEQAARQRQAAEADLAQQRALAEGMLKEKMQAIQEAAGLRAEAEQLQKLKEQAQEKAKKLQEDKQQIQKRLDKETEGFQKSLEAERKRQLEASAEAERLRLKVKELSEAQAKAQEEAKRFRQQAEEARARLQATEKQSSEVVVQKLETQRLQSTREADDLKKAISELEKERERLKKDAEELQKKSKQMANAQQEQIEQEKAKLQQSFFTEKELLLQREQAVEDERKRLEKQFEDEVRKAKGLKGEQERQRKLAEEERQRLQAVMDEAVKRQKAAEEEVKSKQKEVEALKEKRLEQEKLLEEENKKLRDKLLSLETSKPLASRTKEIEVQTEEATAAKVLNGGVESAAGGKKAEAPALAFDGIREKVPAERLHEVGVLTKKELDRLRKGKASIQELEKADKVRWCLKGQNCVGGVLAPSKGRMSVYQAMKEKALAPSSAAMLLEAQAASGFIVDPLRNRLLSVDEAVKEQLIGPELHDRMLSAERAATGFKDPYTGAKISLFEAMKKGLVEKEQATKFLDVQLATGGIVDPVNSHRVPLQTAYKQGLFDADTNQKLTDPSEDCKLFMDPSTQQQLTYKQLLDKCSKDPETGLLMLPVTEKAAQSDRTYTDLETREVFSKSNVDVPFGKFKGKTVTIWEVINSEYFTDEQRRELIRQYKTGKITVEKIIKIVITVVEDKEKQSGNVFNGLRAPVSASELLESKIINKDLFNKLSNGQISVKEVSEMESVKKALQGSPSIAGLLNEATKEKMPFYQAMKKELLSPETALNLLEAQAATGFMIDPLKNERVPVDEAVKSGLVGPELHERLLSAERAVSGYSDPYTGKKVSLFEAMGKGLVKRDQGLRLLEAQLATGGVIDPLKSCRIPQEVACKRGYFDEELGKTLNKNTDETKVFYDPNSQEDATYAQLMKKCVKDGDTGLPLLPLSKKTPKRKEEKQITEAKTKEALNQSTMELDYGPFKGRKVTIWEIIHSEYITEEQRIELIRQYRTGQVTIERLIKIVITMVDEKEDKEKEEACFEGLRAPVTASSLLDSNIIDKALFDLLQQGKKTPKEVCQDTKVRKYLQGTDRIDGVTMRDSNEKFSIYQAMKNNILQHKTGLALLEAQAGTGFITDPVKNEKYSVDDAVKVGVVGPELHEKLLMAEKAVTGYKDPYTGGRISLFQAMKKELVLREHAIPLLEAQFATGGIIDPVSSHRVPNDVAIQRGFLSKQMSKSFNEPSGDVKGFTDPNTNEGATYKQLLGSCSRDPNTGLCYLPLSKVEAPAEISYEFTEEQAQKDLSNTQIEVPHKSFAGKSMSIWEIMNSNMLPEEERRRLMEQYRLGQISKDRMLIIIIEIIEHRESLKSEQSMSCDVIRRRVTIEELYSARILDLHTYNLLKQEKMNIREVMEMPSVKQFLFGTGCIAGIMSDSPPKISIYQAMKNGKIKPEVALTLLEAQAATGFMIDPVKDELLTVDEAVRKGLVGPELHDKLLSAERAVTGYKDPYSGKVISLFQAMKKGLIPEDYALRLLEAQNATGGLMDPEYYFHLPTDVAMQRGYINKETLDRITEPTADVRGYTDPTTDDSQSYAQLLKRCRVDKESGLRLLSLADRKLLFKGLRKQITVDELLRSQIIDQKTYNDLTEGILSVEEVSRSVKKYLEGTSCIAGVYVESSKDRLSIYQAMKRNMIRPGTAFELLEAQAATGYVIDPIKNLKLNVSEAVKMSVVGPEFKDKLLSAERAVTGYRDPYSGKVISLFQAMKKGLILKDHGIRLLEAQIATGGIIDPEGSHRLPVETAYERGLFDQEMNEILTDPSDDTKGFFDPNTEENLTYLQLMERCMMDPETGLRLLLLKEKKRERKTSSKSSVRKRRVVIVDPESGKEMSVYEAYQKGLIDHQTYLELAEQECEWEEITITSSDGVVKSMIIDRRSGRQYDIDDAISKGLIDKSALDQYRAGTLSITEFADMLSGNMSGSRSRSSSFGSSSSYPSPIPAIKTPPTTWNDPTEETGPVAGILDTETLEKVSVTEAIHRNLVDNITGQRLLEAQACTGGIIDPNTGEKFSINDAMNKGLVDKIMVDRISLSQKAYNGFEDPRTKTKMSAAQALKKGWLYYEAGQRFLEVQYLTGGLIDPESTGRVSIDEAVKKGTLDARTAQKLRDVSAYSKYLTCPKTKLKISYKDAMERSMIEEGTGLRLLEASSQSTKGLYSPYSISGSGSATGSRSGSRTGSRSGSRRGSFDATGSASFTTTFSSSSSYGSPSYSRRY
ncbi:plectin a isoform 4-T4 [Menidia menidia]